MVDSSGFEGGISSFEISNSVVRIYEQFQLRIDTASCLTIRANSTQKILRYTKKSRLRPRTRTREGSHDELMSEVLGSSVVDGDG
jgi:hypothetical protein